MFLQTRGLVTAADVAEEFEISTRTARRDLEALALSGVPIYSQPGRGGGWRLVGGARTDLTGLSSDEARALFLALAHQRERNPMLEAALRKLVVAVPERFRDDAVAATEAIRVDATGWGHMGAAPRDQFVDLLSEAVITARQVQLRYATPNKEPSTRVVHPLGLVTKRGVWYLVANTAKGIRTFRLSRVLDAELLDAAVDRPADFDLDATWESIVIHVEQQRYSLRVRTLVQPQVLGPVKYVFSNRYEIVGQRASGQVEMTPAPVVTALTELVSELADQWLTS